MGLGCLPGLLGAAVHLRQQRGQVRVVVGEQRREQDIVLSGRVFGEQLRDLPGLPGPRGAPG